MKKLVHSAIGCIALFVSSAGLLAGEDGATMYNQSCASCLDGGNDRAPVRDTLRQMQPERVLAALESGSMWSTRIGKGGTLGGIQWGSAADPSNVYVALSDVGRISLAYSTSSDVDPKAGGGMFALRLNDGERVWYTPAPACGDKPRCSPAQSAAVSAIPGVAFSGSVDGHFRAYSTSDGKIVWD